jgi:hypothetical protein
MRDQILGWPSCFPILALNSDVCLEEVVPEAIALETPPRTIADHPRSLLI